MNSKEQAYERLVKAVQEDYRNRPIPEAKGDKEPIYVHKCKHEGKRLNLWSYWQGSIEADILVVGQDWGCFLSDEKNYKNAKLDTQMKQNFESMDEGYDVLYFRGTEGMKISDTDKNLMEYFRELGTGFENITEKNSRLFFSNLCLGYRNKGFTGNFDSKWLKDDLKYFVKDINEVAENNVPCLLDILEPKYILCMGKEVFYAICEAMNKKISDDQNLYELLDEKNNCIDVIYKGKPIKVIGLAHPGNMGTANRYTKCKKDRDGKNGKELQKEDWRNVAEIINAQSKK